MDYAKGLRITKYRYDGTWVELDAEDQYALSENQAQFCNDAFDEGLEIDWTYSGRGMYGKYCPAVRCDYQNDFRTTAKVQFDSMGRGVVIYAQS